MKMKIERELPELIPMFDQRVTIHYGGIKKICKSCYLYHRDQCQNEKKDWADYVKQFAQENPRILAKYLTRQVQHEENKVTEKEAEMVEEDDVCQVSPEPEVESQDGSLEDENADVNDDDDSEQEEDEQDSETNEEFEIRKETALKQASVAHAEQMYDDLLKSHGKKWADKMKCDLKDIARSKIKAELIKRNSVVLKRNFFSKN